MIQTKYGSFNGDTWEDLCQQVFKAKYGEQNYQEMPASPGDFGIEGFIKNTGVAFQCYCPDNHYTQEELYIKQRDKITKDLGKLKKYESQINSRIGNSKIKEWVFLTPLITDNKLLRHSQTKETEVQKWNLSITSPSFKVVLKDADFYTQEIYTILQAKGSKLTFLDALDNQEKNDLNDQSDFEKNIRRKNKKRCVFNGKVNFKKHERLNKITLKKWTDGEAFLIRIGKDASDIYAELIRVISQYENEVEEFCITWQGDAESLVSKIKQELGNRIGEAIPRLGEAERYRIADEITSKWLALCPLDIEI